jgi:hypothetical protein
MFDIHGVVQPTQIDTGVAPEVSAIALKFILKEDSSR